MDGEKTQAIKDNIIVFLKDGWSIHVAVRMAGINYSHFLQLKKRDKLFADSIDEIIQPDSRKRNRSFISMAARG